MEQREFIKALMSYPTLSAMIHQQTPEEILRMAAEALETKQEILASYPVDTVFADGQPVLYRESLQELQKNIAQYDWVYARLEDDTSRSVLFASALYRILLQSHFLEQVCSREPEDRAAEQLADSIPKGEECTYLLKCKSIIREKMPRTAVYLNYRPENFWEVPQLLRLIQGEYSLRMRLYRRQGQWQTAVYAMPPRMRKRPLKKDKRVVLALSYVRGWRNVEFIKDRLCLPYLFHKLFGYEVRIIGERVSPDYGNLKYVPGAKVSFVDCWDPKTRYAYIRQHAEEIDLITAPEGQLGVYGPFLRLYKSLNPRGRIFLSLDANAEWMDVLRYQVSDRNISAMECCDVIGAACRSLQKHLNEKFPYPISFIPNGFYDYSASYRPPVMAEKENIILTVSRLGAPTKGTDILLKAFAQAAPRIPDWKLRLVGNVDEKFRPWLESFLQEHEELCSRIELAGCITDRAKLNEEYHRAKVFALPSLREGTPNVIAEGLVHGCAMCVSRFDSYNEATRDGRCGVSAALDDAEDFGQKLAELCSSPSLEDVCRTAYREGMTYLRMENTVIRLHEMLFGEGVCDEIQ